MTAVADIEIKRNDTRRHVFKIKDSETKESIDITGWASFVLSIHTTKTPIDNTTEVESISGVIVDAQNGRVGFTPSGNLSVGKYFYDAQGLDANGERITFVEGKYDVDQDRAKG